MSEQVNQIATVFDSEGQHAGEVYAKALLQSASSANKVDLVVDQFESFVRDVLDKNPKFELVLSNPKTSNEDKIGMIDRVFGKSMDLIVLNFLKVVCRRNRLQHLRSIASAAVALRDEWAGRLQVHVTTSAEMTEASRTALQNKLKSTFNKDVRLLAKVDPSILGGLVVRIGDTVYDGSVDGQLKALRREAGAKAEAAIRAASANLAS